jgi:hypothetical protein
MLFEKDNVFGKEKCFGKRRKKDSIKIDLR